MNTNTYITLNKSLSASDNHPETDGSDFSPKTHPCKSCFNKIAIISIVKKFTGGVFFDGISYYATYAGVLVSIVVYVTLGMICYNWMG